MSKTPDNNGWHYDFEKQKINCDVCDQIVYQFYYRESSGGEYHEWVCPNCKLYCSLQQCYP